MTKPPDAVSVYFTRLIDASAKTQEEIAREAGFQSANTISMIKSGRTKLPMARIPALAKALDSDPREMFALALETYHPEIFQIYATLTPGMLITTKEYDLIQVVRKLAGVRTMS